MSGPPAPAHMDQGSTAVEASIILSLLLLLLVATIEFGRALWTNNIMLLAVQEAGRFAMISNNMVPADCGAQSQAAACPALSDTPLANCAAALAQQVLSAYRAANIGISAREDQTTSPAKLTVCASYSFDFAAPGLLPYGPLSLKSQVTVPLLAQR